MNGSSTRKLVGVHEGNKRLTLLEPSYFGFTLYTKGGGGEGGYLDPLLSHQPLVI